MKNVIFSVVFAAAALSPIACTTKEEGGVPGTKDSFTVKADKSVTLEQGEKKNIDVTIDRKKDFNQDIEFTVEPGKDSKIKATVDPKTVKMSDGKKATLTIEAEKDAPVKDHTITLTAKPMGEKASAPAPIDIKVTVKEKK